MSDNLPQIPQTHKLLLDEGPVLAQRSLVRALKLEPAIVIQQIHYLIYQKRERLRDYPEEISRDVHDGNIWIWNTYEQWQSKYFDYLSLRNIQRIFLTLEKQGLLLTGNYNASPLDKTKWYSVNYHHPLFKTLSSKTNKKDNSFCEKTGHHKVYCDDTKMTRSSCQIGDMDETNLAAYKTKKSISKITTTTPGKLSSKSILEEEKSKLEMCNTFPVPTTNDQIKDIIRDVISITYPNGERIRNINNLVHSMQKKLLKGNLDIPECWNDFQKKKQEKINISQTIQKNNDEIDFKKAKKDFSALPDIEQKKYLDVARRYAKFTGRISESEIQINAVHVWTHERAKK